MKIPLVDILIIFIFLLWVIKLILDKSFREVKSAPAPFWAFLVFAVISSTYAHSIKASAIDIIQIIDYYLLGYILFINNIISINLLYST